MILTGSEIHGRIDSGEIQVDPFDPRYLEPNSYGFHLGPRLLRYTSFPLDPSEAQQPMPIELDPHVGFTLYPGGLYLGETAERMGSDAYAATLYANRSTSTLGMWLQASAPLGHTGASIPWTLEISVAAPTVVFSGMLIGKIAFWRPLGAITRYDGKYVGSERVTPSRLSEELGDE